MGMSSGMSCCALIIPLRLPNLCLEAWGDDYTRESLILFKKKKKKKKGPTPINNEFSVQLIVCIPICHAD